MAKFEGYERREAKILEALKEYGITPIRSLRRHSPYALKTQSGHTQ